MISKLQLVKPRGSISGNRGPVRRLYALRSKVQHRLVGDPNLPCPLRAHARYAIHILRFCQYYRWYIRTKRRDGAPPPRIPRYIVSP